MTAVRPGWRRSASCPCRWTDRRGGRGTGRGVGRRRRAALRGATVEPVEPVEPTTRGAVCARRSAVAGRPEGVSADGRAGRAGRRPDDRPGLRGEAPLRRPGVLGHRPEPTRSGPADHPGRLLHRPAVHLVRAADLPAHLPVPARPLRPGDPADLRRHAGIPRADRPGHPSDRPAVAQRRAVPRLECAAARGVRAADRIPAGTAGRAAGLVVCAGAPSGAVLVPELGPARRPDGRGSVRRAGRAGRRPPPGAARAGLRGPTGGRRGAEVLPADVRRADRAVGRCRPGGRRDAAAGGSTAGRGAARGGPAGRALGLGGDRTAGHRCGVRADQPAVHGRRIRRLVGVLPVPVVPADRRDDELDLVLGQPAGRQRRQPGPSGQARPALDGVDRGRSRAGPARRGVAGPPARGVPVAAGGRRHARRLPAAEQSALAAVRALAAAVLRTAADPGGVDPGLLRRRRGDGHRLLPLAVPAAAGQAGGHLRLAGRPGDHDRGLGAGGVAGRPVRGVPGGPVGPDRRPWRCRPPVGQAVSAPWTWWSRRTAAGRPAPRPAGPGRPRRPSCR